MNESSAIELACEALQLANSAGAESAEASVSVARRFHAEARENAVSKLEGSTEESLLARLARRPEGDALDLGLFARRDGGCRPPRGRARRAGGRQRVAGLPDAVADEIDLELYDAHIADRDGSDKVDDAIRLERLIREADSRIVNSSGSNYTDAVAVRQSPTPRDSPQPIPGRAPAARPVRSRWTAA